MSIQIQKHYDVIISGAGMVGASIAIALAQQKLSVLLIEAKPVIELMSKEDYGLRVSAFTPSSKHWLQHVGVWDQIIRSGRSVPFLHMQVWDAGGKGELQFHAHEIGVESLGYIIDNAIVQEALIKRAQELSHGEGALLTIRESVKIQHIRRDSSQIFCELSNSESFSADLLVGADGGHSFVREWAGIPCTSWSYGQKTIVGQISIEKSHDYTCWQRFLNNGPIALLPLADGRCSLAWHTTPEEAEFLLSLPESQFAARLYSAFEGRFGTMQVAGSLGAYPLRLNHARQYVQSNLALVGDAIHTIHPLAGLGVNLGFLDAATLVDEITHAETAMSALSTLQRYERRRKAHNLLIMGAMDMFKRTSTAQNPVIKWGRNYGLSLTNHLTPVKSQLAKVAMGFYGDLPPSVLPDGRVSIWQGICQRLITKR